MNTDDMIASAKKLPRSARHTLPRARGERNFVQHAVRIAHQLLTSHPVLAARALSPWRQFQLASLLVLLIAMFITGWWISIQIEQGVGQEAERLNSLYIDSMIAPYVISDPASNVLPPIQANALNAIYANTLHPNGVNGFNIWTADGRILYSTDAKLMGQKFPVDGELRMAASGQATWELGGQDIGEPDMSRLQANDTLGIYSPVHQVGTGHIIAVYEIYRNGSRLRSDIRTAQEHTWLIVGGVTTLVYLLLAGFVQRICMTLAHQQKALRWQVAQLSDLLAQNETLSERARQATHRVASLHEHILRDIGTDLHDGPAQYVGAALLRLDLIAAHFEGHPETRIETHVGAVKTALTEALAEVRGLASGLVMPHIETLPLEDVVLQAIRSHEQTYHTRVAFTSAVLDRDVTPSIKMTVFRVAQEGLSNAYRHGGGRNERLSLAVHNDTLLLTIADSGPGFDAAAALNGAAGTGHIGLAGMRDRVESLGGKFCITSLPEVGTTIQVELPVIDHGEVWR